MMLNIISDLVHRTGRTQDRWGRGKSKEDGKITLRCTKSLSDSIFKQLARSAKVKLTKIERN